MYQFFNSEEGTLFSRRDFLKAQIIDATGFVQ